MPEYVFVDEDGETVEEFFWASEVCNIGEVMEVKGRPCVRVAVAPQLRPEKLDGRYHFQSLQFGPGVAESLGHKRVDEGGAPLFDSKKEVREFISKYNDRPTDEGRTIDWSGDKL